MHKWAKSMADSLKAKVDEIGVSNIDGEMLCDLEKWASVIASITQFDKDYKIVEAMEDAEAEDIVDMADERRYYRGQPRTASGRFKRRGYSDDMYYPQRDMDRGYGRMYFDEDMIPSEYRDASKRVASPYDGMFFVSNMGRTGHDGMGMQHDSRMGKSGMSRRTYMESKEMGKDKETKIKDLDKYLDELKEDMMEMVKGMTSDEKVMWQQRLSNMANNL